MVRSTLTWPSTNYLLPKPIYKNDNPLFLRCINNKSVLFLHMFHSSSDFLYRRARLLVNVDYCGNRAKCPYGVKRSTPSVFIVLALNSVSIMVMNDCYLVLARIVEYSNILGISGKMYQSMEVPKVKHLEQFLM